MKESPQQVHKAGVLKQTNKKHKTGGHSSKSSINKAAKGKIEKTRVSQAKKKLLTKEMRRHQATQIRNNKCHNIQELKKSLNSTPQLVCILPLNRFLDPANVLTFFTQCDDEAKITKSSSGVTHISIPRYKRNYAFVIPNLDDHFSIMDTVKVCDTILFAISAVAGVDFGDDIIDDWGNNLMLSISGQGLPTSTVVVTELEGIPQKKRAQQKDHIQKLISKCFPEEKIMPLDKSSDALAILRKIGEQKRKVVLYRDRRPYLYAQNVEYEANSEGDAVGMLKVTGYLQGTCLSVNDLVHIPGLGDFQMHQIVEPHDPFIKRKNNIEIGSKKVLEVEDPTKQESLEIENISDSIEEEDDMDKDLNEVTDTSKQKVPAGFSEYQSLWIADEMNEGKVQSNEMDIDEEDESGCDLSDEEEEEDYMQPASDDNDDDDKASVAHAEFADTASEAGISDTKYDKHVDWDTEVKEYENLKAAKSDLEFPDEIDTPQDVPARIRFKKYRAFESLRNSKWKQYENLPNEYSRILKFKDFRIAKNLLLKKLKHKEGVKVNTFITVYVKNVPQQLWSNFKTIGSPVVLFGMLPYERKISLVNVVLKKTPNYTLPIKSKERLIFQCGYKRFIVNPIFSEHTERKNNKFLRFYQEEVAVATFYGPIQFPPAPVLCYKEVNHNLVLVAHGNLLSCDANRIILKRAVLSGHPFKIHKSLSVVRFMFFNRDDILYFKNILEHGYKDDEQERDDDEKKKLYTLRTKFGEVGFIKEPLGSHGHMKCIFKHTLKSMDTVLMTLYKRVFPKWTYEECIAHCNTPIDSMQI